MGLHPGGLEGGVAGRGEPSEVLEQVCGVGEDKAPGGGRGSAGRGDRRGGGSSEPFPHCSAQARVGKKWESGSRRTPGL